MNKVFIPKQDNQLPDFYGIKITFITGKYVEHQVASHSRNDHVFGLVTHEDLFYDYPMTNIISIEYDKNFSKVVKIREELARIEEQKKVKK